MVYQRRADLLRLSETTCMDCTVFTKLENKEWFTDSLYQKILVCLQPYLVGKIEQCLNESQKMEIIRQREFQVAFHVKKENLKESGVLLLEGKKEPSLVYIGSSGESDEEVECISPNQDHTNQLYKELTHLRLNLVILAEPNNPQNPLVIPGSAVCSNGQDRIQGKDFDTKQTKLGNFFY